MFSAQGAVELGRLDRESRRDLSAHRCPPRAPGTLLKASKRRRAAQLTLERLPCIVLRTSEEENGQGAGPVRLEQGATGENARPGHLPAMPAQKRAVSPQSRRSNGEQPAPRTDKHPRASMLDYRTRLDLRQFQLRFQIFVEDIVAFPLTWYNMLRNRKSEFAKLPRNPTTAPPELDCRGCHGLGFETCRYCEGVGHRYFWGSSRRQEYDRMRRAGEARHWRTIVYGLFHIERREVRCRHCRGFGWVSCRVCHGHQLPKEWETMYR